MCILLEISNESYRHSVVAHQPITTYLFLWFYLRNDCVLQDVETIGERATRIRKIRENFLHFHFELLVRLFFTYYF